MRYVLAALSAGVAVAGLVKLADATQSRPEPATPGSRTVVVFDVDVKGAGHQPERAARALWGICQDTFRRSAAAAVVPVGAARYSGSFTPALGNDARRRLRGCLEDLTVDRARGRVVQMVDERAQTGR